MGASITVRDIDPADKSWPRRELQQIGISMEDLIRRLIHEIGAKTKRRPKPSDIFAWSFGEEHDVELPSSVRCGFEPVSFSDDDDAWPLPSRRLSTATAF